MNGLPEFYNRLSNNYDVKRKNRYFRMIEEIEFSALSDVISENGPCKILEMGCGTGIFLERIIEPHLSIFGLDISGDMLEKAADKSILISTNLIKADATRVPLKSHVFDLVFSFKVLPHIEELERALNEIERLLKDDGIAVLEFYNRFSFKKLFNRGHYFHLWHSPKEAQQLIRRNHFELLEVVGARIITPFAILFEIPIVRNILLLVENFLSTTILNRFAGYYILICKKQDP